MQCCEIYKIILPLFTMYFKVAFMKILMKCKSTVGVVVVPMLFEDVLTIGKAYAEYTTYNWVGPIDPLT